MQRRNRANPDMRGDQRSFGKRFDDYNLIAAYPDMRAAKKAIDLLELAGIDAAEYSLLGPAAEEAVMRVDKAADRETDARATRDVAMRAVIFGAVGVGLGAILAALLAAIPGWPLDLAYNMVIFPIVLGTAGAILVSMSTLEAGPEADTVYRPVDNEHVLLGVATDDPGEVERAESALNRAQPLTLHRYGGRPRAQA